ncbi:ketosteroid isomerase-like protein [Thermocatellispora tengchongensis]|uniref:Ketosteroid isomerase-like protein n=1 Tax=Thermocatellispora tengchongensis TaxID=1073253 RepID=A0A840PUR9_9ACTN|nr:nuclear transport factor 2 family protein [Thermocatellispora tengchongensis]MBB5139645.1 ketosteroid isomerase-like protein [Thermocatellispora tengchongensis]
MPAEADPIAATERFLDLLENGDRAGLTAMLDDDVVWSVPMTATGDPGDVVRVEGKDAFLARVGKLETITRTVRFVDRRISVTADGATTFVQARGDFRTTGGTPYRNTYVFRFDWLRGKLRSWEEYANPIAVHRAFPELAPRS